MKTANNIIVEILQHLTFCEFRSDLPTANKALIVKRFLLII